MVVLIQFVTLVGNETLVWQFDVALIGILFMYGVESETFFCQVTTYCKICSSFWREKISNIHQYLRLGIGLKNIQYIITKDGIKLSFGEVGPIVIIIS